MEATTKCYLEKAYLQGDLQQDLKGLVLDAGLEGGSVVEKELHGREAVCQLWDQLASSSSNGL